MTSKKSPYSSKRRKRINKMAATNTQYDAVICPICYHQNLFEKDIPVQICSFCGEQHEIGQAQRQP